MDNPALYECEICGRPAKIISRDYVYYDDKENIYMGAVMYRCELHPAHGSRIIVHPKHPLFGQWRGIYKASGIEIT
jgi:hypothetical protein